MAPLEYGLNKQFPKIIGFCGYATVGKDYSADLLLKYLSARYIVGVKKSFASSLKTDCKSLYDIFEKYYSAHRNDDLATKKELFRPIWVLWSRVLKDASKNDKIWVERLRPELNNLIINNLIPLVTDVRYIYEVEEIVKMGGCVIRINSDKIKPANAEEEYSFGEIDMNFKRSDPKESKYCSIIRKENEPEEQLQNILTAIEHCGFKI